MSSPTDIAYELLGLAARLAPAFADWLADASRGRSDDVSVRVQDILPATAQSRAALRELEK